jgi:anhydro-N-acetylmuramic acid kinase
MGMDCLVGLMSGTSLDGVDAVATDFSGPLPQVLAQAFIPFPHELRAELLALNSPHGENELERAALAANHLARLYAEAAKNTLSEASLVPQQVRALGCHGQTVRHRPEKGFTLQLMNGALLAELTGITVVTDFRSRDIAAGGQGAPLVPAFHDALFRSAVMPRIIVNLGGFSNLTLLVPGKETTGYDCGPANVLLDAWIERHQRKAYDLNGEWSRRGTVSQSLLESFLKHPHFARSTPKSTGRDEFHLSWVDSHPTVNQLAPEDVQATLAELAARSIAECILEEGLGSVEVFCCGGGARNTVLLERLQALLPHGVVKTTESLGVPVTQVEAMAFAWLARELLAHRPGNLPAVTGAHAPVPLGAIYPA